MQQDFDGFIAFKEQCKAAVVMAFFGLGQDAVAKINAVAHMQALRVADEGLPAAQIDPFMQCRANRRIAPAARKLRRYDARVVEDQAIAFAQPLRQVADRCVHHVAFAADA